LIASRSLEGRTRIRRRGALTHWRSRLSPGPIVRRLTDFPELGVQGYYALAGAFGQTATRTLLIDTVRGMPGCAVIGIGGNGITCSSIASQVVEAAIRGAPNPDAGLYAFS
jgi:hypothetical protein